MGGGYSTELIARAVAPGGIVYGRNAADLGEKAKAAFDARLKTPAMKDVVADVRPFDDPASPGVHDLDLITFLFYYHDTTYMNVDRAEMDRNMRGAQTRRHFGDRRSFRPAGPGHLGRQDAPSHRGKHAAQESRSGRFPRRCRRQFLATSRRHARLPELPADHAGWWIGSIRQACAGSRSSSGSTCLIQSGLHAHSSISLAPNCWDRCRRVSPQAISPPCATSASCSARRVLACLSSGWSKRLKRRGCAPR